MNEVSDIRDTLTHLDRRLGEIRQHVGRILREAEAQPEEGPPFLQEDEARPEGPPFHQEDEARPEGPPFLQEDEPGLEGPPFHQEDEVRPEEGPAVSQEPSSPGEDAGPPPPPPPPPAPGGPPSSGPVTAPDGGRFGDDADTQVQQLRLLREGLIKGMCELIRSYERQLEVLEASLAVAASPPVFEGVVGLVVAPVSGIRALGDLEDTLRVADGVERAAVSRYEDGKARIELALARPVELTRELARLLPEGTAIHTTTPDEIVVEL